MQLLFPDSRSEHLDIEAEVTEGKAVLLNPHQTRFEAIEKIAWENADAIIVRNLPIDAAVIKHLKRARIVVRNGVGYDIVDLKEYGEQGIAVCNVPDYGTTEVADTAIAMMLTFARGTAVLDTALRANIRENWTHTPNITARRLRGACFGVIGLGRIGTTAALRARAFGMNVVFYDSFLPNGAELAVGFSRALKLQDLMSVADVVSIHTPLTDETRCMINAQSITCAKPGLFLINTCAWRIRNQAAIGV